MNKTNEATKLYQKVQDRIENLIYEGAFKAGQRIPSIRQLSRQMGVSINTVKEAYEGLERRRLVEARPQSGYYVVEALPKTPKPRSFREEDIVPAKISTEELYRRMMHHHESDVLTTLSIAKPNPDLLPARKLNRLMY